MKVLISVDESNKVCKYYDLDLKKEFICSNYDSNDIIGVYDITHYYIL